VQHAGNSRRAVTIAGSGQVLAKECRDFLKGGLAQQFRH
jgi:hypothetical protein